MKKRSLRKVRRALSVNRLGQCIGFVIPVPTFEMVLSGSFYCYSYQVAMRQTTGQ